IPASMQLCGGISLCSIVILFYMFDNTYQQNPKERRKKGRNRPCKNMNNSLKRVDDRLNEVNNTMKTVKSDLVSHLDNRFVQLESFVKESLSGMQTRLDAVISEEIKIMLQNHYSELLQNIYKIYRKIPFDENKSTMLLLKNTEGYEDKPDLLQNENNEAESVQTLLDDASSLTISLKEMVQCVEILGQNNSELLQNMDTDHWKNALAEIENAIPSLENDTDKTLTFQMKPFYLIQNIKRDIESLQIPLETINSTVISWKENDECREMLDGIKTYISHLYPMMHRLEKKSAKSSPIP
ncbi:unnamed protein product, partial [Meganyctiphanes norvegica]